MEVEAEAVEAAVVVEAAGLVLVPVVEDPMAAVVVAVLAVQDLVESAVAVEVAFVVNSLEQEAGTQYRLVEMLPILGRESPLGLVGLWILHWVAEGMVEAAAVVVAEEEAVEVALPLQEQNQPLEEHCPVEVGPAHAVVVDPFEGEAFVVPSRHHKGPRRSE